jgi:Domain of unknown function (DUF4333)
MFLVVAFAASACHRTRTIDRTSLEDQVKSIGGGLGTQVASVSCPDRIPALTGYSFVCTVRLRTGGTARVQATETDDQGHVTVQFLG